MIGKFGFVLQKLQPWVPDRYFFLSFLFQSDPGSAAVLDDELLNL